MNQTNRWMGRNLRWGLLFVLSMTFSISVYATPTPRVEPGERDNSADSSGGITTTPRRRIRHKRRRVRRLRRVRAKGGLRYAYWRTLVYRLRNGAPTLQRDIGRELRRRGEARALPYILGMLRRSTQPQRQRGALLALGQWGIPWTRLEVKRFLQDASPEVQAAAKEAHQLLLTAPLRTKAPMPPPFYLLPKARIQRELTDIWSQSTSFAERLERLSRRMLGTPYRLDPLGEGPNGRYDRDPIFSFRQVDCVTYLEQLMALSLVQNLSQAIPFAQKIRYEGAQIDYRYRRHLPIAQWIPAMQTLGFARDITREIGGTQARLLTKALNRMSYSTREGRTLIKRLGRERVVYGTFQLPYLPLDVALANLHRIPSGTILSSIRAHNPYSPGQISHQGLIIKYQGTHYLRHASSQWRSLIDVPLRSYLRILKTYPRPRIGIHLLQLVPPSSK